MELLLPHLVPWLLVLFRIAGIFLLAPILGSQAIPMVVKAMLTLSLACCVYPMLLSTGGLGAGGVAAVMVGGLDLWTLIPVLVGEMLFGWVIGYCALLPLVGLQVGGSVLDQQMGITAGGVFNPDAGAEMGATAQLLYIAGLALFVLMGGHHAVLAVLIGSFETFPLAGFSTGARTLDPAFVADLVLGLLGVVFDMAIRIAAPMLCIVFLESVAMGFISRTVPQMNILSVGFIVRILGGIAMLVVGVEAALRVFGSTQRTVLEELTRLFGAG